MPINDTRRDFPCYRCPRPIGPGDAYVVTRRYGFLLHVGCQPNLPERAGLPVERYTSLTGRPVLLPKSK